jgi:2',3'-cyclic-nucleotide 2'-phosphodiesterase/3'-nucleotidase
MSGPIKALQQRKRAAALRPLARIMGVLLLVACHVPRVPGRDFPTPDPRDPPTDDGRIVRPGPARRPPLERPRVSLPDEKAERAELVLLSTTDVHNRLYPYDYYTRSEIGYGLARLKPIIDSVRAANRGSTYLFDSGDLLQGNPLGFVYARYQGDKPNPVIRAMNLLGYDAATIGNHEYNYGVPHLENAVAQARFPFLSGNTFKAGTNEHAFKPYALIPHVSPVGDTILIGVTGNTPPGVAVWDRASVEGKLEFRDIVASLKPIVAEMKTRGADVVVIASHGGFEGTSYDTVGSGLPAENAGARLARVVPDIDVILMGHTHQQVADTTINGVLFTQAGMWAQALAAATLTLEQVRTNEWRVVEKHARLLRPDSARADTAFLDSLRWEHERTVEYVSSPIGRATARMDAREARSRDTPIADFINEVQRKRTGAELSATPVFSLRSALPQGQLTVADVAGLYVYDNTLKAISITGEQLRAYLEKSAEYFRSWPVKPGETLINPDVRGYNYDIISGVDYVIDLTKPVGQRITQLLYEGQSVKPDQSFTIALNNYRQSGGGGFAMLSSAPVVYDKQEGVRELLIEEIQNSGRRAGGESAVGTAIAPDDYFKRNWRILPEVAESVVQAELRAETAAPTKASGGGSKRVRVLGINDFHGRLLPEVYSWSGGRMVGGAAALASYFNHERAGFTGPTITLDGGDEMQGTPLSNLLEGKSSVEVLIQAGIDAAAIGNHDFDWTIDVLRQRIEQAKYPWMGANIYNAGATTHPAWAKGTTLIERAGIKIGVIGLSTESTPTVTKPANVRSLEFRSGPAEINRLVPELRRRGADYVIVTAHAGAICDRDGRTNCRGEMIEWARQLKERPDLIIGGHTHQYVNTVENGIPIVQAASYSTRYSVTDLEKRPDGSTSVWVRGVPYTYVDQITPDSAIAALVTGYEKTVGPQIHRVIAELADPLHKSSAEYALGRLIADAQRAATGSQIAVMNNGGIRTEPTPARKAGVTSTSCSHSRICWSFCTSLANRCTSSWSFSYAVRTPACT